MNTYCSGKREIFHEITGQHYIMLVSMEFMVTVTKSTEKYINTSCKFCFLSDYSRLIQLQNDSNLTLGSECLQCGDLQSISLTTAGGVSSNDPDDFNFNITLPTNTGDLYSQYRLAMFPVTRNLAFRTSMIKWTIFYLINLLLYLIGMTELITSAIMWLLALVFAFGLTSKRVHSILLGLNMLSTKTLQKLRTERISYIRGDKREFTKNENPGGRLVGAVVLGSFLLISGDPSTWEGVGITAMAIVALIFAIALSRTYELTEHDLTLPEPVFNAMVNHLVQTGELVGLQQQTAPVQQLRSTPSSPVASNPVTAVAQPTSQPVEEIKPHPREVNKPAKNVCDNCGEENAKDAAFCSICGEELKMK